MNLLAIIGYPVRHALSPLMHTAALNALGLPYHYEAVEIEPQHLGRDVAGLVKRGCTGFNVTIPHKQAIIPLLQSIDEEAKTIGAVNTVLVHAGKLHGLNTDVDGVLKSLEPHEQQIQGKSVVLLGAGGAARAVLHCLTAKHRPARLVIATRTLQHGKDLAASFGGAVQIEVVSLSDTALLPMIGDATLIVNATPIGMNPDSSASPLSSTAAFHHGQIVFDLIYTPMQTTLLKSSAAQGATTIGGLEMLIQQGARAFELFTGKRMPVELVREALEKKLRDTNK
jgi:shikimate dehydrogenase